MSRVRYPGHLGLKVVPARDVAADAAPVVVPFELPPDVYARAQAELARARARQAERGGRLQVRPSRHAGDVADRLAFDALIAEIVEFAEQAGIAPSRVISALFEMTTSGAHQLIRSLRVTQRLQAALVEAGQPAAQVYEVQGWAERHELSLKTDEQARDTVGAWLGTHWQVD